MSLELKFEKFNQITDFSQYQYSYWKKFISKVDRRQLRFIDFQNEWKKNTFINFALFNEFAGANFAESIRKVDQRNEIDMYLHS